jgi:hypothetical protein
MPYILPILAFVWFAFLLPPTTLLAMLAGFALVAAVAMRTVQAVTGAPGTLGEVIKSVGLACFFVALATFALGSFAVGGARFGGAAALGLILSFLAAYVLGFKVGMGISMGAASVVAAVSTALSLALFYGWRALA